MRKPIELNIGDVFGQWTVTGTRVMKRVSKRNLSLGYYPCVCSCGTQKMVSASNLTSGRSLNCGCNRKKKHGDSLTKLYNLWHNIKSRCYAPSWKGFEHYGGRGITVCDEWRNSYITFRDWALANGYEEGLEIDRINNNGNYTPENCRFVTPKENTNNRRVTVYLTAFGETKSLSEWLDDPRCVTTRNKIYTRLRLGWDHEAALITP